MLLSETGYHHNTDKRLHIYLTNSLEESNNEPRTLFAQWLSREATEANVIKRDYPVMVMIGNPPYSGESQNKGKWIMSLMESYKKEPGGKAQLNERNPKWLNDDYVKFIRLAQDYIEKNGEGIIGFINPHGYLDNPTFRGMRWNLLKTFDKIYTIDLHGNSKKKETCPDGSKDENVFDIMQGVSINLFVKTGKKAKDELGKVYHKDLYGLRQRKYDFLDKATIENVGYKELNPKAPMYFFVPKDFELQEEYDKGFKIDELFNISSVSVVTANDSVLVDINENNLMKKINEAFGNADKSFIERYSYRPFDDRYIYYDVQKIERPRETTMRHMKKPNIAILTCRQLAGNEWLHVSVADSIVDDCRVSSKTKERGYVFPLYIYKENMGKEERIVNFNKELYDKIAKGLNYLPCYDDNVLIDPTSEYNGVLYPQDLFDYIYAVLHSPSYRERYKEFLKIDFPRIPYPTDWEKFRDLVEKGKKLRHLHLMEDLPHSTGISFPVSGTMQVDCYRWEQNRVYINSEQYFEGVPESAWNFYIGGYQPAQKWLKDRKGITLCFEDVKHYQRIIYVLQQTERLMQEIDEIRLPECC
jgi:predicted helicase